MPPAKSGHISCALIFVVFVVYAYTAYPTISGGDSGELVVAACNLGAAHPPGYPTWTLLAALFVRAPIGWNPAWRANIMSCLLDAVAAGIICQLVQTRFECHQPGRKMASAAAGILAGGLFAFSPTIWLYAVQAEVFALNNILVALVLYLYDMFEKEKNQGRLSQLALCGAFLSGLALTNQHTTIFLVGPIAMAVLVRLSHEGLLGISLTFNVLVVGLLGLSPYVYLYVTTSWKVKDGWGSMITVSGFLRHFLRKEYGTFQLTDGGVDDSVYVWYRLLDYVRSVHFEEGLFIALPLALCGCVGSLRTLSRPTRTLIPLSSFTLHLAVISYLANMDTERALMRGVFRRFWQQPNVYLFILCGDGANVVCRFLGDRSAEPVSTHVKRRRQVQTHDVQPKRESRNVASKSPRTDLVSLSAFVGSLSLVITQCARHFEMRDFHDGRHIHNYGEQILNTLPHESILLVTEDLNNNAIKYVQECEGLRDDVSVLSVPLMTYSWWYETQRRHYPRVVLPNKRYHPYEEDGFSIVEFLAYNVPRSEVFIAGAWYDNDESYVQIYERLSYGLVDRIVPKPELRENSVKLRSRVISLRPFRPIRHFQEYARFLWKGIPSLGQKPPPDLPRFDAESWESELRKKYVGQLLTLANELASRIPSGVPMGTPENDSDKELRIRLAAALFARLFRWLPAVRQSIVDNWLGPLRIHQHLKNAGTLFGQLSAMEIDDNARSWASMHMYYFWKRSKHVLRENPELGEMMDRSIAYLVETRRNPYTGASLTPAQITIADSPSFLRDSASVYRAFQE